MTVSIVYTQMAFGGVERVFCDLANGLAESGLGVDLVLYKAVGTFLNDLDERVNVVDLNVLRHPYSLFAFAPLVRYLGRRRPETVLSAVSGPNVAVLLALLVSRLRSRSIVTYHSSIGNEALPWLLEKLQSMLYRRAHCIVAVSDGVAEELASSGAARRQDIRVIYNPVDVDHIAAASREAVTDTEWFEPGSPPVVLAVGRLAGRQKGFEMLVTAFALLRRRINARLLLLGDGEARAGLEAKVSDEGLGEDVRFLGFTDNPYKYMHRASVFVLPSSYEGLPTVLIEALACGCPVVSTDCPHGPREILEDGRWGRLVPVGDAEGLAAAIEQTLAAPPPAAELVARAEFFRKERAVRQYYDLIAQVQ